jgi:pimeloyl-ACP methyl ester carboxylesterase
VSRTVTADDGTKIAWHEHLPTHRRTDGAPTVLLTNGIFTTENFWRELVAGLTPQYRVVHWDYRGHGQSETARGGEYSQQVIARDLLRVIEAVTAEDGRPPMHVAFSMGVSVLLELYRTHPEQIPAMALLAGAADGPFAHLLGLPTRRRIANWMDRATPLLPWVSPVLSAFLRSPLAFPLSRATGMVRTGAPREDIEVMAHAMSRMEAAGWWHMLGGYLVQQGSDVLPRVKVPTLIIGAEKDVLIRAAQVEALCQGIPHARFRLLMGAGHASLTEVGPQILDEVLHFFEELRPS